MGVRLLLRDLRGMVCYWGEFSTLRGKILLTVRPLDLGEEFRDGGRLSKTEFGWSINNRLAGSGGVSSSIRIPVGVAGFIIGFTGVFSCSNDGSSKSKSVISSPDTSVGGSNWSRSKVSCRFVIKVEIFRFEPSSPNRSDASVGSVGLIFVTDGSSRSILDRSKSDKSVGGLSRSRVSLQFRACAEVELSLPNSREASEGLLFNPRTIRL